MISISRISHEGEKGGQENVIKVSRIIRMAVSHCTNIFNRSSRQSTCYPLCLVWWSPPLARAWPAKITQTSPTSYTPATPSARTCKRWRLSSARKPWPLMTFSTWSFWASSRRTSLRKEDTRTGRSLSPLTLVGSYFESSRKRCWREWKRVF